MKTRDVVLIGGGVLLIYLLLRKSKRGMMASDIKNSGAPAPAPATPKSEPKIDGAVITKGTITASSVVKTENSKPFPVALEEVIVPRKKPIYVATRNLIPDYYDRGVGQPIAVAASGDRYYNMSGTCSENVQNACKCSVKDGTEYKLDIPKLP